jgi:hypothetical protein
LKLTHACQRNPPANKFLQDENNFGFLVQIRAGERGGESPIESGTLNSGKFCAVARRLIAGMYYDEQFARAEWL